MLHPIYLFKHWHEDAQRDGRVVVRVDRVRYEGQVVRVTDAALDASLRSQLETMAARFVAPEPLALAPTEPPNDTGSFVSIRAPDSSSQAISGFRQVNDGNRLKSRSAVHNSRTP